VIFMTAPLRRTSGRGLGTKKANHESTKGRKHERRALSSFRAFVLSCFRDGIRVQSSAGGQFIAQQDGQQCATAVLQTKKAVAGPEGLATA
jgi:hypothetical protein